jgi:hypothetical protein
MRRALYPHVGKPLNNLILLCGYNVLRPGFVWSMLCGYIGIRVLLPGYSRVDTLDYCCARPGTSSCGYTDIRLVSATLRFVWVHCTTQKFSPIRLCGYISILMWLHWATLLGSLPGAMVWLHCHTLVGTSAYASLVSSVSPLWLH